MRTRSTFLIIAIVALLAGCGGGSSDSGSKSIDFQQTDFGGGTYASEEPQTKAYCASLAIGDPSAIEPTDKAEVDSNIDALTTALRDDPDTKLDGDPKKRTVRDYAVDMVAILNADDCDTARASKLQAVLDSVK